MWETSKDKAELLLFPMLIWDMIAYAPSIDQVAIQRRKQGLSGCCFMITIDLWSPLFAIDHLPTSMWTLQCK